MADYNYFAFIDAPINPDPALPIIDLDKFKGTLQSPVFSNTPTIPTSSAGIGMPPISQPGDVLKFSPGLVYGTNESLIFNFDYPLAIESLNVSDWTLSLKNQWFQSWMIKVGLGNYINHTVYNTLFSAWETDYGFEKLSGLSLAYAIQDSNTFEIKLGINSYVSTFFQDWVFNNPSQIATDIFGTLKPGPHYISHVGKITYGNHTDYVWSFANGFIFNEYNGDGALNGNIVTGGGNAFVEVKLAALNLENGTPKTIPHYIIRKNVPDNDPTRGIASIESVYQKPFCIGDVLTVLNNSTFTTRSNNTANFTWTWFGNLIDIPTAWYLADASDPCNDYRTVPIFEQLFPLRVISECKFENFN